MEQVTVIVAIGRNARAAAHDDDAQPCSGYPLCAYSVVELRPERWEAFTDDVWDAIDAEADGTPGVVAHIIGDARSDDYGSEQSAWFAGVIPAARVDALRCALRVLARRYGQDAIGLTVGEYGEVKA